MDFLKTGDIKNLLASLKICSVNIGYAQYYQILKIDDIYFRFVFGPAFSEPGCADNVLNYKNISLLFLENGQDYNCRICPITDYRFKMFEWCKYFYINAPYDSGISY